jgi:hypothetical protein
MNFKAFMGALSTQTLGFSFGNPWRPSDNAITCVVPILRELQRAEERGYITAEEAGNKLEIIDSGRINKATVSNTGEVPIFIRMGTLLKGNTQERAVTISRIIAPGQTTDVEVVCVHASKGIVIGTKFSSGGYAPRKDEMFASAVYNCGSVNQSVSWTGDREYHQSTVRSFQGNDSVLNTSINFSQISADNVSETHQKVLDAFKDIAKDMPYTINQIGFGLIDMKGFHSLDCFDLPESWKAVKEAITGKEALQIAKKDESGVFQYNPNKAAEIMTGAVGQGYEDKIVFEDSSTKTIAFDTAHHIGEAVMLGDTVIHLLMSRKDKK